jgi:fructuronate reductase
VSRNGRAKRPVRIAHLGTGNFFRAHQAWYTEHASDAADWGIAAFAGRSAGVVAELAAHDGLYTLLVRAADGDRPETISALSTVSADLADWRHCFAEPKLALVTMTVTEAGYRRADNGGLDDSDPAVQADIETLRSDGVDADVTTAPGKLALGLAVRRAHELPGLAIVPCDNVPDNGSMVARVLGELAEAVDPDLAAWVDQHCSFVTTMVDRITPQTTTEAVGAASVVTEPYSEWVLSGEFPQGRPRWEDAGARFVDDITDWENRKLWLLNGSHSLMAYAGTLRGHDTVFAAVSDPIMRGWIEEWWDDAARHLSLPSNEIEDYRQALLVRYQNPRIRHLLAQIAADGSQKIPIRILPTVRADLADGRLPTGAARVLAAWICHLRGAGAPIHDVAADEFTALAAGDLDDAVQRVLARLGVDDEGLRAVVLAQAGELC